MKRILITGANSYLGESVENWLHRDPDAYSVDSMDLRDDSWKNNDFSHYDVIYHVAGIAHSDVENVSEELEQLYYKVNTELAVDVAEKAKNEGVKQFIFMSSMIIYYGCNESCITKDTIPSPVNCYGDSKWRAEQKIRKLETPDFKVVILRAPMVYGSNSKGNYQQLAKLATKLPVFPKFKNKRSMIFVDNLCEFIKLMIDNEESGIFFPQNAEHTVTCEMVKMIAKAKGHKILIPAGFGWAVKLMMKMPGKIGKLSSKAFGDFVYDLNMSGYKQEYRVAGFEESVRRAEG